MMNRFKRLAILLVVLASIAVVWKVPIKLGLDLKGGIDVTLEAQKPLVGKLTSGDVDKAKIAIQRRIDQLGVSEPLVIRQGERRIRVQLPGIKNQKKALEIIGRTAQLTFKDVNGKVLLTGADLKNASAGFDNMSQPAVNLEFSSEGKRKFSQATRNLSMRPTRDQRIIAMYLDKQLISAPAVQFGEPITDGKAQITGVGTIEKAKETSLLLNAGSLPVPVKVIGHTFVDPTLGQESIDTSVKAGILGLAGVLLFMVIYYRLPGFIADIALCIYALITVALFSLLGVTLTLPGIAGFILSVGMAVDANVIIFERMKEEMKSGKNLRAAIQAGFTRAWAAILDGNLTTLITSAALFLYGTGPIKGFAVTLSLGIIASMFTAIVVTRILMGIFVDLNPTGVEKFFKVVDFTPGNWNIIGKRGIFLTISAVMLIAGLGAWGFKGLNKGIDFNSGTLIQVRFLEEKPTVSEVEDSILNKTIRGTTIKDAVVQPAGNKFIIRTHELTPDQVEGVMKTLEGDFGKTKDLGTDTIGPVIGKELTRNAVIAVILASIGILIYMGFRFELSSALAAVIAMVHDVFMVIGIFAILQRPIDSAFVAAILTIVGYSVNDTIVVFDRIRENIRSRKNETFEELVNTSILQTMARSLNTGFGTLLTIISLLIFGASNIQNFLLAIFLGIIFGTYSSVFIASPIWVAWRMRRERRKA